MSRLCSIACERSDRFGVGEGIRSAKRSDFAAAAAAANTANNTQSNRAIPTVMEPIQSGILSKLAVAMNK